MELFNDFSEPRDALSVLARAGHVLAGVTWIGLLYFFNFVQVPAYAELSDGARSEALRKLTFRALWWFRYAALLTFLFGDRRSSGSRATARTPDIYFEGVSGTAILTGMLFGITMFLNVWGVIWRNQKIVIGNAENVAAGGEANPEAPAAAKRGRPRVAVQHPVLDHRCCGSWCSPPTAACFYRAEPSSGTIVYWVLVLVLWAFIEASALGLIGGLDSPFNKRPSTSTRTRSSAASCCWRRSASSAGS